MCRTSASLFLLPVTKTGNFRRVSVSIYGNSTESGKGPMWCVPRCRFQGEAITGVAKGLRRWRRQIEGPWNAPNVRDILSRAEMRRLSGLDVDGTKVFGALSTVNESFSDQDPPLVAPDEPMVLARTRYAMPAPGCSIDENIRVRLGAGTTVPVPPAPEN